MRFHVLVQYAWPDDAPIGVYAEQLADALVARGHDVVIAAGRSSYRRVVRPAPTARIVHLRSPTTHRGRIGELALEYAILTASYRRYVLEEVMPGDVVVVSSNPPPTVFLHRAIHSRGARSVYWLQDYYPELLRGLYEYPRPARLALGKVWDAELGGWQRVVKSASNLGYGGPNTTVIRNWPSLALGPPRPPRPRTALYTGNLGYAHDVESFVAGCRDLREQGYRIVVRGDGPGMRHLPPWIDSRSPTADVDELVRSYWEAEVHLVAAHPRITSAVFPSKIWNCLATGRRIVTTGFAGPMLDELRLVLASDFRRHRDSWVLELERLAGATRRATGPSESLAPGCVGSPVVPAPRDA
jgi:hypothetical protein